jgi:RNA polymerase sigma-70 factor, ECF subfamily
MPLWEHLETHIPGIYRFALRLTGCSDRAEDLTQETLLKAWRKHGQLRDGASARVWLFRIAVNLWRDQLRQNKHRPVLESGLDALIDPRLGPEDKLVQREEILQVLKAIEQLPARQREVLHLSAVEDLSISEIAEVLSISPNSVRVNLSEARKKMRDTFPLDQPSIPRSSQHDV